MPSTLPKKAQFNLPEDIVYLDGNSLGPLPVGANQAVNRTLNEEWGSQLIRAWNKAGWMSMPQRTGDRIAKLVGAPVGTVTTGDTLSIKVYQALSAALSLRPGRKIVLSDSGNFPTDLYMAEGLFRTMGGGIELKTPAPEDVLVHINDDVAVVMLTQVDYRTGRLHDMQAITKAAHEAGALVVWDLAHSAGAMPIELGECEADFAVGCTYKYLNAGPGAPAFIYISEKLIQKIEPALSGWLGHDDPFAMELVYRPAMSIERMRVGTPSIVQFAILDKALDIWNDVSLDDVRKASIKLSELFISEVEKRCPQLALASPRDSAQRGSQVSFSFSSGYAVVQALIADGVIGDFRPPNIMRFGFTPLYIDKADVLLAVDRLELVMQEERWKHPDYQTKLRVT